VIVRAELAGWPIITVARAVPEARIVDVNPDTPAESS